MISSRVPAPPPPAAAPWRAWPAPARLAKPAKRGKTYCHEVLVAIAASGGGPPRPEWIRFARGVLAGTLQHLVGPAEPLEPLLEMALTEASPCWLPTISDEPLSIRLQRIAVGVAQRHRSAAAERSDAGGLERPGGVRELLARVYAVLGQMPQQDRLAFALVDLGGRSLGEAGAVFDVPSNVLEQRVRRARRRLLFAARRDALLLRYLSLAARWRRLACRSEPPSLASLRREGGPHTRQQPLTTR
jgi:hypothetical protein